MWLLIILNSLVSMLVLLHNRAHSRGLVPSGELLQIMRSPPRLAFTQKYLDIYTVAAKQFLQSLPVPSSSPSPSGSQAVALPVDSVFNISTPQFAVADWRRGDYCKKPVTTTIVSDDKVSRKDKAGKKSSGGRRRLNRQRRKLLSRRKRRPLNGASHPKGSRRKLLHHEKERSIFKRSRSRSRSRSRRLLREKKNRGQSDAGSSVSCSAPTALSTDVRAVLQSHSNAVQREKARSHDAKRTTSRPVDANMMLLVATNDGNQTDLQLFSQKTNMRTISDLLTSLREGNTRGGGPLKDLKRFNSVELYVIETLFMLHSPIFLSYGWHAGSDLVEYERMMNGRSYCLRYETQPAMWGSLQIETWCQVFKASTVPPKKSRRDKVRSSSSNQTTPLDQSSVSDMKEKNSAGAKGWKTLWGLIG